MITEGQPATQILPDTGGQRRELSTGLVQPWYTHGALDEIMTWDLKDKVVLEWGGGASTLWWAAKCKHVHTVEHVCGNPIWWSKLVQDTESTPNVSLYRLPSSEYSDPPIGVKSDIVVIDGSDRTECLVRALTFPRPLTIIFDNYMQDGVYYIPETEAMMEPYRSFGRFFVQADHTAHEGHPWQTAVWRLP